MAAVEPHTEEAPPARPEYADPVDPVEEVPAETPDDGELPSSEATLPPIADPDGELEELEDRSMPIERTLWSITPKGERFERVYVQRGLMWFGKLELYGLLGKAAEVVLEGDNPLGIGSMLDMVQNPRQKIFDLMGNLPGADTAPDRVEQNDNDMEIEAGKILAAFAKVISLAPELVREAYCIVLEVPKTHRNWAIEWAFPNMDDDMGKDILAAFIDQNWGVMEDFFGLELPKIVKRVVKARQAKASAGRR
jgi:hypothetical protein